MRFGPKTIGAAALALTAALFFSLPASTQVNIGSVVLRAGSAIIGQVIIVSQAYTSGLVTATRPADTTAYTANDVVGAANGGGTAAWTFPNVCPAAGRQVYVSSTLFTIRVAAVPSGMTSFRLYLYNATPPSALADNAPFDYATVDLAVYQGYVDLGSPVDLVSNLFVQADGIQHRVTCGASTSLFGYTVTNSGYTPTSEGVKSIELGTLAP